MPNILMVLAILPALSSAQTNGCIGTQCLILAVAGEARGPAPTPGSTPTGDGGPAVSALLDCPEGLGFDGAGNLYIGDSNNQVIRKLPFGGGPIGTIAGQFHLAGDSGDGSAAGSAYLDWPATLRADAAGYLYIGCGGNLLTSTDNVNNVRRINLNSGEISTFAGQADSFGAGSYGGDGGQATSAQLSRPYGLAISPGAGVYISDTGNHVVRLVDSSGVITTVAGDNVKGPGFSGDGGAATSAQLNYPMGLCLDGAGNLYIADAGNARVRKMNPSGIISTVAGDGTLGDAGDGGQATSAQLRAPYGVAVDSIGNLFIVDHDDNRIREVGTSGVISTVAGAGTALNGDGSAVSNSQMLQPYDAVVDAANNLYVAERYSQRGVNSAGEIREIQACGCGATPTNSPTPSPSFTANSMALEPSLGPSPNPFTPGLATNNRTQFNLPAGHGPGRLSIFGLKGNLVYDASFGGDAAVLWDGISNAASIAVFGVYVYVIQADGRVWKGTVTVLR